MQMNPVKRLLNGLNNLKGFLEILSLLIYQKDLIKIRRINMQDLHGYANIQELKTAKSHARFFSKNQAQIQYNKLNLLGDHEKNVVLKLFNYVYSDINSCRQFYNSFIQFYMFKKLLQYV